MNYYHSDFDLLLDPRDDKFRDKVDELASHPSAISDFLMKAKWIGEKPYSRLHPKARTTVALPVWLAGSVGLELPEVVLGDDVYLWLTKYDPTFEKNTFEFDD